ncbi:50S ribosomal protein L11 methyltransferase [Magnetococcales bacterium HHB-1]
MAIIWQADLTVPEFWAEHILEDMQKCDAMAVTKANAADNPVIEPGDRFALAKVSGYFSESDAGTVAQRVALDIRWQLLAMAGEILFDGVHWQSQDENDWQIKGLAALKPLDIGQRLRIEPRSKGEYASQSDRLTLFLTPGMAFGSGDHPTTKGCLEALESRALKQSLGHLLDMGTGSGVLMMAALHLGAQSVVATEIDQVALTVCQENLNGNFSAERLRRVTLLSEATPPKGPFDTIVANILFSVLKGYLRQSRECSGFFERLNPGGYLILSGLLRDQGVEVAEMCERVGFQKVHVHFLEMWAVVTAQRA